MDPGGKRVRTDSPSTDSQRDGPKTRKSAKRDSKSSENSEVGMRFEAQNPQIRNLHRTPRRRKLRAQRAHGRKPHRGRAAGWLHGNSPKGTSRIENRNRAKRAPPKPRDGTLPKKQSRLAQGKTGGAENPKRSLLRIRPWAREIRAEPAEHGAKTPAGMAAALRKKGPAFRFGKARPTEIGPMEEVVFKGTQGLTGPKSEMDSGKRAEDRTRCPACEGCPRMQSPRRRSRRETISARGCPFQKWKRQPLFLKFKVSRSIFVGKIIYYNNITI